MEKKIALVTGANSGMGMASARMLARKGYFVLMLVRSEKRGNEAFNMLNEEQPGCFQLILCDLSDLQSVRRAAASIGETYEKIDVMLNNAGVITTQRELTKEGLEMQFGVNHVGHFLLTMLLLQKLQKGSRIIQVASGAHKWGDIYFEDLSLEKSFRPFKAYGQSKLANVLFAKELSKKLTPYGIAVNSCHPGAVATNMGVNRETGFGRGITKLLKPFFRSPEDGAATAVYLATDPSVEGITGEYFYNGKSAKVSTKARNEELSRKLFQWTEDFTGVFFKDIEEKLK
ncbi:SDR family oxidoreductase [Proteiniclasticum ruminis]|uniref:NAD(P)-dependent dehydrogenase, short-chain alcohol dehydrogenase family n=1 Tax=Proteiniclasticum ruminis TaxID=398199 RepID=A0A1I5DG49_9CLOT|nr:SDR family oxidoreductase [Proteiniclasticum ruminis]SFN98239.1 NAD(P)-dependent dehydrogenase, short-chain alcohol dehydrogenase family [Proteiniclasticum ruminis]